MEVISIIYKFCDFWSKAVSYVDSMLNSVSISSSFFSSFCQMKTSTIFKANIVDMVSWFKQAATNSCSVIKWKIYNLKFFE